MKKILMVLTISCFAVMLGFAQSTPAKQPAGTSDKTMMLKGTIIDNACATANKDNLSEFIKTHPKSCALMPSCVASGYSIYIDGKLQKFDAASNKKIETFLKKKSSKLDVVVTVKKVGEELSLISIKNQK